MSKPKPEKFTATVTPEKLRPQKPFVQIEGELTQAQLEAIADGLMKLTTLYTNFKEELMSRTKARKIYCYCHARQNSPRKALCSNRRGTY